ncbi:MAG TPA: T9SS type A sorting domain-containing protein [Hanamia sp.]
MKKILLFICVFICIRAAKAQISYTWNGSVSSAATVAANWSPNGIPGPTDNATIVTGSNICALNINASIANLTVTSGTLDLGGNTLTISGSNAIFTSGTVQNGTLTVSGATTTTFGNGTVTMNCIVNVTSAAVTFRNTTFQQTVNVVKTGASNDASSGNNIFNGSVIMTNAGSGYLMLGNGNPDQFHSTSTFNNTGSNIIYVAYNSSNNIFGGVTTFNNTPTANTLIYVSQYSVGTLFNNNIVVTSTNGQGVQFCNGNASASATLASGNTISAGAGGFSAGTLSLKQFTQAGATPQNITLTGNATANFIGTTFNGALSVNSPNIYTSNSIYNNATVLTKTDGTNTNATTGGNTFNAALTINYTATNAAGQWFGFGNGAADLYNGDVYINNSSSDRIILGYNSTNNQYNGNLIVTQTGSAVGIALAWISGTSSIMATGKSISIGAAGFTTGYLGISGFTQNGSTAINLTTTGSSSVYVGAIGGNTPSVFGGSLTITSPDIYMRGGTYNAPVSLTKTGGGSDHNNGYQNIFNSTLAINQQSNSGYFMLGYNSNDLFNDNITLTSSGTGGILLGYASGTGNPTLASGKTILIGGAGFNAGYLQLNKFTQLGNTAMNLAFTGTNTSATFAYNSVIGGNLVISSPDFYFNGCTFNGSVDATKTGATGDYNQGGNIFNGLCNITNNSAGYIVLASTSPDIYNNDVTFTNNGSERILPAYSSAGNQFNGNILVNTTGSAQGIYFCGGNSTATATLAAGKTIQAGVTGLNAGYLILRQFTQLGNTPVNLTLNSTATTLQFGPGSAIGGNLTSSSPGLLFNGCTFSGTVTSTKTGAGNDASSGDNVFNGTVTMTNAGSGYLMFGNGNSDQFNAASTFNNTGSSNMYVAYNSSNNIFGGIATFNNTPTANTSISVSSYSAGTVFNDSIVVTSSNGQGVQFCSYNLTASATLAAGKTISIGAGGFSAGTLLLRQFAQIGSTAQSLALTGSGNLTFGPNSAFGGNVTSVSPSLYFNGCTFSGTVNSVKTGATGDISRGNNVFNNASVFTNSGSGQLYFGNGNSDQFNAASTFNNTGSSNMYVAYNSSNNIFGGIATFNNTPTANTSISVSSYSVGTVFNSNIVVTSNNGQGVQFCNSSASATATLAAGKTISVGAGGFSAGTLLLRQFTQVGATPQGLTLTGSGNLTFGPISAFGGNVTSVSPSLYFNGCNFSGTVNSVKTGTTSDASTGNNVFNDVSVFTNSGSGYLMFGNGNADQFNAASTFNNTGSSYIYVAYNSSNNIFGGVATFNNTPTANTYILVSPNSAGTVFNSNIVVTSNNGQGVQFCNSSASATVTLAAGKTISVGAGGFSAGTLLLKQFTQVGATPQSLTLTGSGNLTFGPISAFGGNVTTSSPALSFNGCSFSGTVNSTKTGTTNDQSQGNNIFNSASTFTNNGTGYLLMTINSADAYNSDVTFVKNNSGLIYPNYNNNSTYSGNLTVSSSTAITFGANSGTAIFNGGGLQNINAVSGTPAPVFTTLVINNTGSGVTLNNTSINVSNNLTLTSGLLNTSTSYILTMLNGSVTAAGNALSTSYVNGPMRYQKSVSGISTLNFPIGNSPDCRPVVLTVNHSNGTLYTYEAQLFDASAAALGYTLPPTVDVVSHMHYYTISRKDASGNSQPVAGLSGNQTIQIFFGNNDVVLDGGELTIVKNTYTAPTSWIDIGGTGGPAYAFGANLVGSITSTSSPTAFNSFSTFAIADDMNGLNTLPVQVINFNAQLVNNSSVDLSWTTETETNNNYFTIEKSSDAVNFEFFQNISSKALNGNSTTTLNYIIHDANPYNGTTYYRLKQTDLNGNSKYWNIVSVTLNQNQSVTIYPNPTTGTIFINGLSVNENNLKIEWLDISGRLMSQENIAVMGGTAKINVQLSAGVYILLYMTSDGSIHQQRVIIKK